MLAMGQGKEKIVRKMVFLDQSHCHNRTMAVFFCVCVLKDEANKGKEKKKNHKKRPSLILHICSPADHCQLEVLSGSSLISLCWAFVSWLQNYQTHIEAFMYQNWYKSRYEQPNTDSNMKYLCTTFLWCYIIKSDPEESLGDGPQRLLVNAITTT